MIRTKKGKLYTGITTDVERRFKEHQRIGKSKTERKKGAKYFQSDKPVKIVYIEKLSNRSEATKREIKIKKLNHYNTYIFMGCQI